MTAQDAVATWGCIVCANIQTAQGTTLGYVLAAIWLMFALAITISAKHSTAIGESK